MSLATAPGAVVPSVFSISRQSEKHYSYQPFHSRGTPPKRLAVGMILHFYWNTVPSGAEHCSCLIAHSNITQADGKESKMCKKRSFHFPSNASFLSSLSTAICANSRQLQMCVFPTSICRDLALETGICLPTYCLLVLSAPRVEFLLPHSPPWLCCQTCCGMEGRRAGKEQFCFLLDEYSVDVKLFNMDKTLLPSKYTKQSH